MSEPLATPVTAPHSSTVTLRDVALEAGVSPKTVSRVMNRDVLVAEATRTRVQAVIERMGYQPDLLARSLRMGRDQTIGLVVESVQDSFFASIVGAVEVVANARGYSVYVVSTQRDAGRERTQLEGLLQRRVAGLIVAPSSADLSWLRGAGVPTVFVDREAAGLTADVVRVDDRAGAHRGVAHLAAHGHRRIAFTGGPAHLATVKDRHAGYLAALDEVGATPDPVLTNLDVVTAADGADEATRLLALPEPPTALFVAAARCLDGVVLQLHQQRRTDVALVGFGDIALAAAVEPGITVIDHSPERIGETAAQRLLAHMAGSTEAPTTVMLPMELIERGSGELAP